MFPDQPGAVEGGLKWIVGEEYWSRLRKTVVGVLEERIEEVRHGMRADELKSGV